MSLTGQIGLLATRVGTELKSIRSNFVPNTLRGPIGGLTSATSVSGTITLDPTVANHRRLTLTGDTNLSLMAAGADGQKMLIEVNASGAQRVFTVDSGYELSNAVTVRTFTIPLGAWAYITLIYRNGTWRLTSAEPQPTPDYSTPSVWQPADHGLLAWSYDPMLATSAYVPATNGQMFGCAVKVSSAVTAAAISYGTATAGSGFTAGRNGVALYNAAGSLLAQTSDMSTSWTSSLKWTTPFTSSVSLAAGTYYVNFLVTATTPPQISAAPLPQGVVTTGRSTNTYRGYWYSGTYTSFPATRPTPSGMDRPMWVGLS